MNRDIREFFSTIAFVVSCLVAGCNPGESVTVINPDGEARKVSDVIEQFNETRASEKQSEPLFLKGAMPRGAQFKKYVIYSYATTDPARPNGDSATMAISIHNETTGEDAGKVEWAFKKEGDAWKIEKAPLP